MKTKINVMIIVTICVMTFFNLNINDNNVDQSFVTLANIEALASTEGSGQWISCYETISSYGIGNSTHVTYCGECNAKLAKSWSSSSSCKN